MKREPGKLAALILAGLIGIAFGLTWVSMCGGF